MSYAYSYQNNSIDKYESIQSAVYDAYAYLDEVDEDEEVPTGTSLDELSDEDVDALLLTLSWDN